MTPQERKTLGVSAGLASVAVALTLVGLKLWALWTTGALSIAASLADSALDLLMSAGAALAIIYAARPADEDHAFGHTAVEDLTALGQAIVISLSALVIIGSAILRLTSDAPAALQDEGGGIIAMAISILLTVILVAWQGYVAKKTGNRVVAADRLHYLGDLIPSLGAILALFLSARFGIAGADTLIALIAAVFMLYSASKIGKAAWDALMDRAASPEALATIEGITRNYPNVLGFHDLKTRTAGSRIFINLHIELDGAQSLQEAHAISAGLKSALMVALPEADIIIHKDVASPMPKA